MAADSVAKKFRLLIEPCDRQTITNSISNRVQDAKRLREEVGVAPIVVADAAMVDINRSEGVTNKRRGRCGRKKNGDDHLPSNKLHTDWHGCRGFIAYRNICKTYATIGAKHVCVDLLSLHRASIDMDAELSKIGVTLSSRHCRRKIKEAIGNGGIGVSPKRSGDQVLPSALEKKIAKTVMALRERHFSVFPGEIIRWAAYEIQGTPLADMFPPDGIPSKDWYRGWLDRMEFNTCALRPLEQTRFAWYTPENLESYFTVARDVLINAGVAELNPNYDMNVVYSEEIIITHPSAFDLMTKQEWKWTTPMPQKARAIE
jgi:hypothetical protein